MKIKRLLFLMKFIFVSEGIFSTQCGSIPKNPLSCEMNARQFNSVTGQMSGTPATDVDLRACLGEIQCQEGPNCYVHAGKMLLEAGFMRETGKLAHLPSEYAEAVALRHSGTFDPHAGGSVAAVLRGFGQSGVAPFSVIQGARPDEERNMFHEIESWERGVRIHPQTNNFVSTEKSIKQKIGLTVAKYLPIKSEFNYGIVEDTFIDESFIGVSFVEYFRNKVKLSVVQERIKIAQLETSLERLEIESSAPGSDPSLPEQIKLLTEKIKLSKEILALSNSKSRKIFEDSNLELANVEARLTTLENITSLRRRGPGEQLSQEMSTLRSKIENLKSERDSHAFIGGGLDAELHQILQDEQEKRQEDCAVAQKKILDRILQFVCRGIPYSIFLDASPQNNLRAEPVSDDVIGSTFRGHAAVVVGVSTNSSGVTELIVRDPNGFEQNLSPGNQCMIMGGVALVLPGEHGYTGSETFFTGEEVYLERNKGDATAKPHFRDI